MSNANPFWGAPRIHGELLKLGIKISQATVGRWMPWRTKVPSPTWRSFLGNHLPDIAAIDMFVVATATFQLLRLDRASKFEAIARSLPGPAVRILSSPKERRRRSSATDLCPVA
jgi:hypothetical protein